MLFSSKKTQLLGFLFILFLTVSGLAQQKKGELQIETSENIDAVVTQKKQYNKNLNAAKGYKIQVYYGNEKESIKIANEFKSLFSNIPCKRRFDSPQWKVQVGNFETRLEADKALIPIKNEYPGAIILATEIDLDR